MDAETVGSEAAGTDSSMSLSLEDVSISLGGRQLVKSVSLTLSPGEVVGLLGPNGAVSLQQY